MERQTISDIFYHASSHVDATVTSNPQKTGAPSTTNPRCVGYGRIRMVLNIREVTADAGGDIIFVMVQL